MRLSVSSFSLIVLSILFVMNFGSAAQDRKNNPIAIGQGNNKLPAEKEIRVIWIHEFEKLDILRVGASDKPDILDINGASLLIDDLQKLCKKLCRTKNIELKSTSEIRIVEEANKETSRENKNVKTHEKDLTINTKYKQGAASYMVDSYIIVTNEDVRSFHYEVKYEIKEKMINISRYALRPLANRLASELHEICNLDYRKLWCVQPRLTQDLKSFKLDFAYAELISTAPVRILKDLIDQNKRMGMIEEAPSDTVCNAYLDVELIQHGQQMNITATLQSRHTQEQPARTNTIFQLGDFKSYFDAIRTIVDGLTQDLNEDLQ